MTSTHKKENLKHFLKLSTLLILNLVCPVGKKKDAFGYSLKIY